VPTADDLRAIALALPEATEQVTWETHPTFRVRGKIFAILSEDGESATLKATREEQAALLALDPETFSPASHVGRFGWVAVRLASVDPGHLEDLLSEAWSRAAPKRLAAAYAAEGE
jgi:hypothetical protein